jgi:hypothetical protein
MTLLILNYLRIIIQIDLFLDKSLKQKNVLRYDRTQKEQAIRGTGKLKISALANLNFAVGPAPRRLAHRKRED